MIFGPPGTGKTTTLLNILEKELNTVKPHEIAFVSFTRKGSYEGKERACKKFNLSEENVPYFRTLHSLAFRTLGTKRHDMIDKGHYKEFSKALGMTFAGYYTEELKHNDDAYLFFDILQRNNKKAASKFATLLSASKIRHVQQNYHQFKRQLNILDFTDLIESFIIRKEKIPVKVAIVDEAQDLTTLQWQMVLCAFRDCERLYLAGDDDQAVYEWSGADVNFFLNFRGAQIKILDKSYRLPDLIVDFSKKIINKIPNRIVKNYQGAGKKGEIKIINNLSQLSIDNQKSWLFLARNNYFLNKYKEFFENEGIVYKFKGELSVKKTEINAIKTYTQCQKGSGHLPSLVKIVLKTNANIKAPWFDSFKWPQPKICYYRNLIANQNLQLTDSKIAIETIHSIKGGEADNVVILEDITKSVKNNMENNSDSEHRIFYTGVTRTKENLFILQNETKNYYNLRSLLCQ